MAAVAGTAAIGYELMTIEEDKKRKERQEMDQANLFGASPVFPNLPILED